MNQWVIYLIHQDFVLGTVQTCQTNGWAIIAFPSCQIDIHGCFIIHWEFRFILFFVPISNLGAWNWIEWENFRKKIHKSQIHSAIFILLGCVIFFDCVKSGISPRFRINLEMSQKVWKKVKKMN